MFKTTPPPPNTPEVIYFYPKPTKTYENLYFEIHQKIQKISHAGVATFFYNLLDDSEKDYYNEDILKITKKMIDSCLKDEE